jgi:hypothetical protein
VQKESSKDRSRTDRVPQVPWFQFSLSLQREPGEGPTSLRLRRRAGRWALDSEPGVGGRPKGH